MRRVDAVLVAIAVVLAGIWYVVRVAPVGPSAPPEPSAASPAPPAASASPAVAVSPGAAPLEAPPVVATVDVVHKHALGSCRGRLSATTAGLRYEPSRPGDGFDVPRASVERLAADARKKLLVVKLRGGRTYNFTDGPGRAEPLLAFQKVFAAKTPRAVGHP